MKMLKPVLLASSLSLLSWQVQAASVNAVLSWEDVKYNDNIVKTAKGEENRKGDRNYRGYRFDMSVSPDNSNWTFSLGLRQNRSNGYTKPAGNETQIVGQRDYQRLDFGVSYRYRLPNGWIQPSFNIRQDKNLNINGTNNTTDYYNMALAYNYNITDRLVWNGRFKPEIVKYEDKRNNLGSSNADTIKEHKRRTQFGWETEQGLRYLISPNFNIELAYNDARKRQDEEKPTWDNSTKVESNQQVRFYLNYKTPFGLTFSPYIYKSIFGKIKVKDECTQVKVNNVTQCSGSSIENRDLMRYAFRMQYQINNNFTLFGEYYRENLKFTNVDKNTTKQNYVRVGMRVTF